jgi:hypothetical protein
MADAMRGTVNGTVAVGRGRRHHRHRICLAGVPHPLLFAVLTIAFAILPCGAWFTFSAAALVRLLHSGSLSAAGLFSFSGAVTLVGDLAASGEILTVVNDAGRSEM